MKKKKQLHDEKFLLCLMQWEKIRIEKCAESMGWTISALIRYAIHEECHKLEMMKKGERATEPRAR